MFFILCFFPRLAGFSLGELGEEVWSWVRRCGKEINSTVLNCGSDKCDNQDENSRLTQPQQNNGLR